VFTFSEKNDHLSDSSLINNTPTTGTATLVISRIVFLN